MEKADKLPCHTACCWRFIRPADSKRHGSLQRSQQAHAHAAGLVVPCSLDHSVYTYGTGLLSGADVRNFKPHCADCIWDSACIQFFLVHYLFQSKTISVCLSLAYPVMAADCRNDDSVPPHLQTSLLSNAALSIVGNLCRLLKLFYLSFKLKRKKTLCENIANHIEFFRL